MHQSLQTARRTSVYEQVVWRVNAPRVSAWRIWDGEAVVYDDFSGNTLKLDAVMSEIFRRLQQGPATMDALGKHLAAALDLRETDFRLVRLIEVALDRLDHCGLVAATPDSASSGPVAEVPAVPGRCPGPSRGRSR